MPSMNLSNGDLDFLYDKIKKLDDKVCDINNKHSCETNDIDLIKSSIASLQSSIDQQYKSLSQAVEQLSSTVSTLASAQYISNRPISHSVPTQQTDTLLASSSSLNHEHSYINSESRSCNDNTASYTVAEGRSRNWGSTAYESADASASEMDAMSGDAFHPVQTKSSRKALKRKEKSPNGVIKKTQKTNNTSDRLKISFAKMVVSNSARSNMAEASSNGTQLNRTTVPSNGIRPNTGAVRPARSNRIIGSASPCNSLKAAPPKRSQAKSVFCLSNLDEDVTVDIIRDRCQRVLNVRVLFCFDITQEHHDTKSFKLAVRAQDAKITGSSASWPPRIGVAPWIYKESRANTSITAGDQLDESSEGNNTEVSVHVDLSNVGETQNACTSNDVLSVPEDISEIEPIIDDPVIETAAAIESTVVSLITKCTEARPAEPNNGCTE